MPAAARRWHRQGTTACSTPPAKQACWQSDPFGRAVESVAPDQRQQQHRRPRRQHQHHCHRHGPRVGRHHPCTLNQGLCRNKPGKAFLKLPLCRLSPTPPSLHLLRHGDNATWAPGLPLAPRRCDLGTRTPRHRDAALRRRHGDDVVWTPGPLVIVTSR